MTTFVLVHGAWHGGWCWKRVAQPLRAAGHEVFTPTMTGLGERAHLASADINLDTHIQDIVATIEAEEIDDIVLCGHSYGGMVVTGVADRLAERIRTLVYLDAFVPKDGQSLFSFQDPERVAKTRETASATGDGWKVPPMSPDYFKVTDPDNIAWIERRCVPQPIPTMGQPVSLTGAVDGIENKVYIWAKGHVNGIFHIFADKLRDDPAWQFHEMACGHEVMIDDPEGLTRILLDLA